MPLARTYHPGRGAIQVTLADAYADRLSRDTDIREYLPLLYATAAGYPGVRVLELGTRKGNSTLAFLAAAEQARGHVWSADIDPCDKNPEGMGPWASCPLWTFTQGDDLHPSVRAAQPDQVDVLFIDTSHFYAETVEELRAYVPRVVSGGVVLCHDTNLLVREASQTEFSETPPVRDALDDYCAEAGLTWENLPGDYGMGRIRIA